MDKRRLWMSAKRLSESHARLGANPTNIHLPGLQMRSAISYLLMICVISIALSDEVQSETDVRLTAPKALRDWVDARTGTGNPVHWIADGGVYAYPSGENLSA